MKNTRTRIRRRITRCGAALLEFVLVLPLLLTIVLAAIDVGRFGFHYVSVTNAARAGAGVGAMRRVTTSTLATWRAEIRKAVGEELNQRSGFQAQNLTVLDPQLITEASTGLRRVHVEVQYRFEPMVAWPGLPRYLNLARTVEMRVVR